MKVRGSCQLEKAGSRRVRRGSVGTLPFARERRQAGLMLEECLVYLAIWAVLMGLAFAGFYRVFDNATRLRRSAADITRALEAGERWRNDVRRARGPIQLVTVDGSVEQAFHVPDPSGETVYFFTGTNVLRRAQEDAQWIEALAGVKASRIIRDPRGEIAAWRWEVELNAGKKKPVVRPLFTFQAVATGTGTP